MTLGAIVATGKATVATQILRLNAADICGRAYCQEAKAAGQRCISAGLLFDTWESSCDGGGWLVDDESESWLWANHPGSDTYWKFRY